MINKTKGLIKQHVFDLKIAFSAMLLGVVAALVVPADVKAANMIHGIITEANLSDTEVNVLDDDATLTINNDRTINSIIKLEHHDLTINGTGTLTINGSIQDRSGDNEGSVTIDGGNLRIASSSVGDPPLLAKNITINGGSVRATLTVSQYPALMAFEHINIASPLEIIKPSGGSIMTYDDGQGDHVDVIVDSNNNFASDVYIAEPGDDDSEKKSKHKKVTTASYDCYYTEVDGQIIYGGLIEDVFAPTPASMIPASAYPKFNAFMVKKISGAEAGSTISVNAEPWESINKAVANAFTEKGDVALAITYRFDGVLYQVTIPAGTNLTELLDEGGYIGLAKLGALYGAVPVTETAETEE